jgi:hypothetical protein
LSGFEGNVIDVSGFEVSGFNVKGFDINGYYGDVIVIAGTYDARVIINKLCDSNIKVVATVTTSYGKDLLESGCNNGCSTGYCTGYSNCRINRTLCSGGVLTPSELRDRYPATRVHPPLKKWRSCTRGSRINMTSYTVRALLLLKTKTVILRRIKKTITKKVMVFFTRCSKIMVTSLFQGFITH